MRFGYIIDFTFPSAMLKIFLLSARLLFPMNPSAAGATNSVQRTLVQSKRVEGHLATQWLWTYNNERPHTAIGGIPPRKLLEAA